MRMVPLLWVFKRTNLEVLISRQNERSPFRFGAAECENGFPLLHQEDNNPFQKVAASEVLFF